MIGGLSGTERNARAIHSISATLRRPRISFDLDLFGAGRAERSAARHRLRATEFDRETALLVVQSEVARAYVQRATLAARIALLDRNIEQARDLERIIRARFTAGDATRVDLGLQTIQVRQLQTERCASIRRSTGRALRSPSSLAKRRPDSGSARAAGLAQASCSHGRAASELRCRPDIRAAESG